MVGAAFKCFLKRAETNAVSRIEQGCGDCQDQKLQFPCPPKPPPVGNNSHAKTDKEYRVGGIDHIAEAVPKTKGNNGCLPGDSYKICQRRDNWHNKEGFC